MQSSGSAPDITNHVERTARSVAELHDAFERDATSHQLAVERLTRSLARPATAYALIVAALLWIGLNITLPRLGMHAFDPYPFGALQAFSSICALIMTVLILTAERRFDRIEERRARLSLQLSMLVESKTTKVIDLLEQLRRDDPTIPDRRDHEAEALIDQVDVAAMSRVLESHGEPTSEDR